jgi:hypothetical protein
MTKTAYAVTMIASALSAIILAIGSLILTIGIHDEMTTAEDSRIVWVCSTMGNQKCGPDQPIVDVQISNILYW